MAATALRTLSRRYWCWMPAVLVVSITCLSSTVKAQMDPAHAVFTINEQDLTPFYFASSYLYKGDLYAGEENFRTQNVNEWYNFIGKKVQEINNVTPKTTVNLNDFYRGIYIFQLRDRQGTLIESGKFNVVK